MMLSIQEVADMFGVHTTSVRSWDSKGILHPDWVSPGNRTRRVYKYSEEKVKALYESCFQCEDRNFTRISVSEASDMFNVNPQTIRSWEKRGELQAVWVSPTGRRYYSEEQVKALYNQGYCTGQKGEVVLPKN